MPQLKVSNIFCEYDSQKVIDDLSFELQKNEIVALLGSSGCGKTTLLKAIAGLMPINQGEIRIKDKIVNNAKFILPSEERKLGMIFQDYALFPHLNVFQNIAFGIEHWESDKRQQRVTELLELIRLEHFAKRFPHELSGGQQQRVALARALAYQPDLILLDEAFSNIDSHSRGQLMQEVRQLLKQEKVAAILVTHSKEEAFMFADKIAIIDQGKIAQMGQAQTLYNKPISRFVANFIGKTNYLKIDEHLTEGVQTKIGLVNTSMTKESRQNKNCLMLRPEQLIIESKPTSQLIIKERAFLGTHWFYLVGYDDNSFSIEITSEQEYPLNKGVNLQVKPHELILF